MPLQLCVLPVQGESHTIVLESNATVKDAKCQIAEELGADVRYFDLVFEGKRMPSESDVTSLGIVDESEVEMIISEKGFALKELGDISPTHENMIKNIYNCDGNLVEYFMDAGVPVDGNNQAESPLYVACETENIKCAKLLLSKGAAVGVAISAIMQITSSDVFYEFFDLLVEHGADLNITDYSGSTPLHHSIKSENNISFKKLLSRGVSLSVQCNHLCTPLHDALILGKVDIATLLIEAGCDLNAKEQMGYTPLHNAVRGSHDDIVQLLIRKGADISIKDSQDMNALEFADFTQPEMAKLIIETIEEIRVTKKN